MDELMEQFAIEARELVQTASDDLLALERNPADRGRLESAFRAVHTLKGSVGLFDFGPMHSVLHAAEELLSAARNGSVEVASGLVDPLLEVVEWIERCVAHIEANGNISQALANEARRHMGELSGEARDADEAPLPRTAEVVPAWAHAIVAQLSVDSGQARPMTAFRYVPHPQSFFNGDDPLEIVSRVPSLLHLSITPREPWPVPENFEPYTCNLVLEGIAAATRGELDPIFRLIPDQVSLVEFAAEQTESAPQPNEKVPAAMRVDPARIDRLVAIAGELVTAKNGLLPLAASARQLTGDEGLSRRILASHKDIERLVSELYSAVTRARLVSLDQIFRRFPRLVRETAARLGKSVEFLVEGGELEADREIVENLFEPLLHLVRNALDHGIETEEQRLAAGKPAKGTVSLLARQRGDEVEVELRDDGRGLDPDRIKDAALGKGLISASQAETLSEADTLQLVFAAGFSTAATVSDLSGRGVGLDAVRAAVQRLGGSLGLESGLNAGTSFKLRVPISFAMSRLIVVEVAGERYGIPLELVIETIILKQNDIMPIRAGEAFVLRDQSVPLLRLGALLGAQASEGAGDLRVLVCNIEGQRMGIAVDTVSERTETLTRPLSAMLRGIPGISGTTLLGDGRILLVLDLEALVA